MHTSDIMHHNPYDKLHEQPELYSFAHNGDFSGDVLLFLEGHHVSKAYDANSRSARHGQAMFEIKIPFEVLKRFVAQYVLSEQISRLEQASEDEILGVKRA